MGGRGAGAVTAGGGRSAFTPRSGSRARARCRLSRAACSRAFFWRTRSQVFAAVLFVGNLPVWSMIPSTAIWLQKFSQLARCPVQVRSRSAWWLYIHQNSGDRSGPCARAFSAASSAIDLLPMPPRYQRRTRVGDENQSATEARRLSDGCATGPRQFSDGCATAKERIHHCTAPRCQQPLRGRGCGHPGETLSEFAAGISITKQSADMCLSQRVLLRTIVGTGLESGPGRSGPPRPPPSLPCEQRCRPAEGHQPCRRMTLCLEPSRTWFR